VEVELRGVEGYRSRVMDRE